MEHLIIGAGIAAASAIKAIRAVDPAASITVVTEERPSFYFRPMLPLVVEGAKSESELEFPPDFFDASGICMVPDRAIALEPRKRVVRLQSGATRTYDRLLIATGSGAAVPSIPRARGGRKVFTLHTLSDAVLLRDACAEARSGVVIGGGLVGLKAALALKSRGLAMTVVEQQGQILFPRIDSEGAAIVAKRLQGAGIAIKTGEAVQEVHDRSLHLASGMDIAADLVVVATGARPNMEWLRSSGMALGQAIITDEFLRTNLADVYAAGDVAQTNDLAEGRPVQSALWSNAVEMGRAAGSNMAGRKRKYPGCLAVMNATELAGLAMVTVGTVTDDHPDRKVKVHTRKTAGAYRKLLFNEDRLAGAVFLGDISKAGLYTNLIRNRTPLGRLKEKAICDTLQVIDIMHLSR